MIHKILLFNVTDENSVQMLKEKTFELLASVPGAKNVTFRSAMNKGTVSYHYLITVDFDSMDAHEQYMVHEKHVHFSRELFRPNVSELLIQFFQDENAKP